MRNKALVGDSVVGGGLIVGPGAPSVICSGFIVACVGDAVAPHGTGAHANATIVTGSKSVFADGRPVARIGDLASCGHVIASGSAEVIVG